MFLLSILLVLGHYCQAQRFSPEERAKMMDTAKLMSAYKKRGTAAPWFNPEERAKILAGDTAKMIRISQTTNTEEHRILRTKSKDISWNDPLLPLLTRRMYLSMRDTANPGVGIAAPQVGINRNIIWVQRFDKNGQPFELYLNPIIIWRSALLKKGKEGCLSVAGDRKEVIRNYTIRISYMDIKGKHHEELVEGYTAVVFQHETDHIMGTLFIDRLAAQDKMQLTPINDKVELFLEKVPERL